MCDHEPENREPTMNNDAGYETFVQLLVAHEPGARAYLRGLLPSWHDVDEVMQSTSLVAWRKYGEYQTGTNFSGWLRSIARFEALKHRRQMARSPLVFSEDVWELLAHETDADAREERREALEVCLGKMSAAQRELVLKAHMPGVRLNEVAHTTGRSEQAFYKTIQRLRAALLECVERTTGMEGTA